MELEPTTGEICDQAEPCTERGVESKGKEGLSENGKAGSSQ